MHARPEGDGGSDCHSVGVENTGISLDGHNLPPGAFRGVDVFERRGPRPASNRHILEPLLDAVGNIKYDVREFALLLSALPRKGPSVQREEVQCCGGTK